MRYAVKLPNGNTVPVVAAKASVNEHGALIFIDEYLFTVAAFANGEWSQMFRVGR